LLEIGIRREDVDRPRSRGRSLKERGKVLYPITSRDLGTTINPWAGPIGLPLQSLKTSRGCQARGGGENLEKRRQNRGKGSSSRIRPSETLLDNKKRR